MGGRLLTGFIALTAVVAAVAIASAVVSPARPTPSQGDAVYTPNATPTPRLSPKGQPSASRAEYPVTLGALVTMASPPTITIGTGAATIDTAPSAISGAVTILYNDTRLRYSGGPCGHRASDVAICYGDAASHVGAGNGTVYAAEAPRMDFVHTGTTLEFRVLGIRNLSQYRVRVNGELAMPTAQLAADGLWHWILVDFGTSATRTITIEGDSSFRFAGVNISPVDTIAESLYPGARVVILGDSFAQGTGAYPGSATGTFVNFGQIAAEIIGYRDVHVVGVGGTGYLNTGLAGAYVKFRDRLATDVFPTRPALVIVAGGINDDAFSPSAIRAEADLLFAAIHAGLPVAQIVVVGPWSSSGNPPAARLLNRDAIKTAALAAGLPFIDPIADYWVTGTGHVGDEQHDGNADTWIGPDGTHPTVIGYARLGALLGTALAAYPRISPEPIADTSVASDGASDLALPSISDAIVDEMLLAIHWPAASLSVWSASANIGA